MTSIQERLQLKRIALDKWTTREQLCLASAVSCSGDQNWMSVSRSLKVLCGANRPADWFSQKSCAVQYGELLENVETPKRKKRTANERDTPSAAETPTESILRKLTQDRVTELKAVIQTEQDEYAKLREEILAIQNANADEQLREMWAQIELETEQKLVEKKKHEQWLKEREERKAEMQKAARMNLFQPVGGAHSKPAQLSLIVKAEDVETDEASSKPGSSPLLTSLLKSPATTPTASNSPTSIRVTAPTITNLLTGNPSSVLSMNASNAGQTFQLIQNQPLTGPVPSETAPQILQSPSKAAPTLSMLLESKNLSKTPVTEQAMEEVKPESSASQPEPMETEDGSCSPNKEEDLMKVIKELLPENMDDIEEILTNNNGIILNSELLEAESILENVESLIDEQEDASQKDKKTDEQTKPELGNSKNMSDSIASCEAADKVKEATETTIDVKANPKIEDSSGESLQPPEMELDVRKEPEKLVFETKKTEAEKISSTSDNDSNDVQIIEAEDQPSSEENEKISAAIGNARVVITTMPTVYPEPKQDYSAPIESSADSARRESEQSGVSLSSPSKKEHNSPEKKDNAQEKYEKYNTEAEREGAQESATETTSEHMSEHTTTITIIDTDEDSTMEVIKEDKIGKTKRDYSRRKPDPVERRLEDIDENRLSISLRKLKERDGSESPLVDDETSDSIPRTRRRNSSTPNIDSIPSSPASSDDREYKVWKKSVLSVYNRICSHKYASMFLRSISDDSASYYRQIILRPMDLQTIKQNIECGLIRTTAEFQRDLLLMLHNAMMYYSKDNSAFAMAREMIADFAMSIDSLVENTKKDLEHRSSTNILKNRARKSSRLP